MARVQCSPSTAITAAMSTAITVSHAPVVELALVALPLPAASVATPCGGPGWFESSWELRRGLEVREGLPADAGLDEWLAVMLLQSPRRAHGNAGLAMARATASPRSITAIA